MRIRYFLLFLMFSFLALACKIDHNYQLKKAIKRVVPDLMTDFEVPGVAVLMIEDGLPVFDYRVGLANQETNQKWTDQSQFPAPSIEHSLCSWAIMAEAQKGKFQLDDPLKKHLKNWPFEDTQADSISIAQVMSHCSGLAPESNLDSLYFNTAPGKIYQHNPVHTALLQQLIEEQNGTDYIQFINQSVLPNLNMNTTSFDGKLNISRHDQIGQLISENETSKSSLSLNLSDLQSFMISSLRTDSFWISPSLSDSMHYPAPGTDGGFGLGYPSYLMHTGYSHSGIWIEEPGFKGIMLLDREVNNGIAVLSNGENGDVIINQVVCKWLEYHSHNCAWENRKVPLARALEKPYREGGKAALIERYDILKKYYNTAYNFRPQVLERAALDHLETNQGIEFAKDLLQLNVSVYPKHDPSIKALGDAFARLNMVDSARSRYQEAYYLNPAFDTIPVLLDRMGVQIEQPPEYEITFKIKSKTVPEGDTVFISGSHRKIGNWEHGKAPLDQTAENEWSKTIKLYENTQIEFKFNRGDWETEALSKNRRHHRNYRLHVKKDTLIERTVKHWNDLK